MVRLGRVADGERGLGPGLLCWRLDAHLDVITLRRHGLHLDCPSALELVLELVDPGAPHLELTFELAGSRPSQSELTLKLIDSALPRLELGFELDRPMDLTLELVDPGSTRLQLSLQLIGERSSDPQLGFQCAAPALAHLELTLHLLDAGSSRLELDLGLVGPHRGGPQLGIRALRAR